MVQVNMRVAVGSDHAGFALKKEVIKHLEEMGVTVCECGCMDGSSCDYPLVAEETCALVTAGKVDCAVLVCGTGLGISIAANKVVGIRAALCTDCYMAKYARLHNDANALCLGGRVIGAGLACEIVDTFLQNSFEGGRHQRRVDQIMAIADRK